MGITEIFGSNVFNESVMRQRLPENEFQEIKQVLDNGGQISIRTADAVAKAMMEWAVERGATHFTHWFQPLTGNTEEKHDSFITYPKEGKTPTKISFFKGNSELIKILFRNARGAYKPD